MLSAPSAVRFVLFDAVGTLLRPQPGVVEAYRQAGQRHGSRLSPADIRERFPVAREEEEERDLRTYAGRTNEQLERARWRRIVARVFDDIGDVDSLFADLWEHFAGPHSWRLVPAARSAGRRMAAAGLRVAWASNFDARLPRIVAQLPELAGLGEVFVSSQLGYRKPHGGFFRAIETRLEASPPASLLLVGDDRRNDYDAAQAAGWQAWLAPDPDSGELESAYAALLGALGIASAPEA